MKNLTHLKLSVYALICGITILITSCSSDSANAEEIEISQFEVQKVMAIDDYSAIADNAITEAFMGREGAGKRFSANKESDCYSTTYSDTGFAMTFTNCALSGSENVNGLLNIAYSTNQNNSSFTSTFTDFYVGATKLNGTRTFIIGATENENEISFTIVSNMTITLEGGEIITEEGSRTTTLIFSNETISFTFFGTWTLVENGDTYIVTVTEDLSAVLGCEYVSKGKFTLSKNGLEVLVDFGDGTCDNKAEIIYPNGKTEEITL